MQGFNFMAAAAVTTLLVATPALAQTSTERAQARIESISTGSLDKVLADYSSDATLHWIGGPLDGAYDDAAERQEVWTRFARMTPMHANVTDLNVAENSAGATVTADIVFQAQQPLHVRYVLLYRGGKLVDEIWQVTPSHGH